jgi:hypothetical protein
MFEPSKQAERGSSREMTTVSRQLDSLAKQVALLTPLLARALPKQAELGEKLAQSVPEIHAERPAEDAEKKGNDQGEVEFVSMVVDELQQCAWQAGGILLGLSRDAGFDVNKKMVEENKEQQVDDAKQTMLHNFAAILNWFKEYFLGIGKDDPDHAAEERFKEVMGKDLESVITRVVGDSERGQKPKVGGINELSMIAWDTHIKLILIDRKGIHAKATDEQVKVACYEAMLAGLPESLVEKTMVMFVVLDKSHFSLPTLEQGGNKRAIFNIGEDADEALDLFIAKMKSQQKGPIEELDKAGRTELIKEAIAKSKLGPIWPALASGAPAASHKNPASGVPAAAHKNPTSVGAKKKTSNTPCRNFEKDGVCSYGDTCIFAHDDSRKARNAQKQKQRQAKSPISVVKASDQQPAQSGWQQATSRKRRRPKLNVRCRKGVHPSIWKESLQSINKAAYELVTWVERDPADEDWLLVQCKAGEEDKLAELLTQDFNLGGGKSHPRAHRCAAFLNGERCNHATPYCK